MTACESSDSGGQAVASSGGRIYGTEWELQNDNGIEIAGGWGGIDLIDLAVVSKAVAWRAMNKQEQQNVRKAVEVKLVQLTNTAKAGRAKEFSAKKIKAKAEVRQKVEIKLAANAPKNRAVKKAPKSKEKTVVNKPDTTPDESEVETVSLENDPAPISKELIEKEVEKEAAPIIAKIDEDWKSQAVKDVKNKYGTNFAVPLVPKDNANAVAFASVKESGAISVDPICYKVKIDPRKVAETGDEKPKAIEHDSNKFAILETKADLLE